MQSYTNKSDEYFAHARKEILPMLPPNAGRVLELGCGAGATLGWLREIHKASYTVGIEISEAAADVAKLHADEIHWTDFEHDDIDLQGQKFNVILCLDVLEHMVDPWSVVDRLVTKYLEVGGTLIVSLPNVRHYSVVLPLLFGGRWDYAKEGLLDRTHLRFFTRESAIKLIEISDMRLEMIATTGLERGRKARYVDWMTLALLRRFFEYQYLIKARKY